MLRRLRVAHLPSVRLGRSAPVFAGLVLIFLLAGVCSIWIIGRSIWRAPLPRSLDWPAPATPIITDSQGKTIAVLPTPLARESYPVRLKDAGLWMPMVTVGIEDARFWKHRGVDVYAAAAAALRNLRNGRVISGASAITQQLIKISSARRERTLAGKIREGFAALRLEREWEKKRILEAYLNRLDYGNRRFGPEAAAQAYFGKSARVLSLSEAIFLAGLPQSPARLNPWKNPDAALVRYRRNVRRLAADGLLPSGVTAQSLLRAPPRIEMHEPTSEASHFVQLVQRGVSPDLTASGKITTYLDSNLQNIALRALREHLSRNAGLGVTDAAIVVIENSTGAVRALACAGDPRHAALNSAVEPRSCGSTLKPFLYLLALDQRKLTASSLLPDTKDAIAGEYRDYDPQNYSKRYLGPVRMREALGNSLNVPAVFALSKIGARETFEYFSRWGLNFPAPFDAYGAGFILGNAPVRLVELAGIYAGLARGGEVWTPRLITGSRFESRRLASPEASAIIADILCDNRARRASFGASSPLNLPERTAVKTGTSSGFRDGWCVGFSKDHTVAVWAGNLDGRQMGELLAVRSAAPLWAAVMKSLYAAGDRAWPEISETPILHSVDVAAETGLLTRPGEPVVREWFLRGTEPVENAAALYVGGLLQLPPEYLAWCAGPHNGRGAAVRNKPLSILFPKDGATFSYDPRISKSQQMLPLQSSWPECEWFLNGRRLESPLVPLERGAWSISARAGGQTTFSNYVVE